MKLKKFVCIHCKMNKEQFILDHKGSIVRDNVLVSGKDISYDFISKNPEIYWDLSKKGWNDDFIKEHINNVHWNYNYLILSGKPYLTIEFIEKNIHKTWLWGKLSRNDCLPISLVEKYPYKPWIWGDTGLSKNQNVTCEFIEKNIKKNWSFSKLSRNNNLTIDFIEKYINESWDYNELSKRSYITIEFIKKHINEEWDWGKLVNVIRNRSAEKIQIKFRDWYYKPICKDGSVGLHCKVTLEKLKKLKK